MTKIADYVWRRWDEDNLPHAVAPEHATGDGHGLIEAVCGAALGVDDSVEATSCGQTCVSCWVFVATQAEDAQWRL
ncbi:hypothetical protein [Goodfellowiella coeruleoviolacea]|uniref:Uncharacterized protein n=1 Tax=Goodfellowiella coeruleoviolacea TaxID=334858 RepID=A0AAE3GN92_9PSEU|nr:hypothetical protein [Goodfellowiella coeruleoviolacea]MCP2169123.1 hypothetical protein [Goodfellowiella coeruleoviolacea]